MSRNYITAIGLLSLFALAGCGSLVPPKYENGHYVPPPARNALKVELKDDACGSGAVPASKGGILAPLATVIGTALVNQAYDRFVNWLDEKKANLSASSSGTATTTFLSNLSPKGCLILTRGDKSGPSLEAQFLIDRTNSKVYWHMTPHSLKFNGSEAKESPDGEKSIVADIQFAAPGEDGKLVTFFQTTFDLGRHKASGETYKADSFVGQDSGPYGIPKVSKDDAEVTMKVTASLIEHGEGRDWIRGVTDALREQENRDKILKTLLDVLAKKAE